jgi:hypothetical protein
MYKKEKFKKTMKIKKYMIDKDDEWNQDDLGTMRTGSMRGFI